MRTGSEGVKMGCEGLAVLVIVGAVVVDKTFGLHHHNGATDGTNPLWENGEEESRENRAQVKIKETSTTRIKLTQQKTELRTHNKK